MPTAAVHENRRSRLNVPSQSPTEKLSKEVKGPPFGGKQHQTTNEGKETGRVGGRRIKPHWRKRGKWGRRRIDLAAWTECRIKNPTSGRQDERRMGEKNLKMWKKRGMQCASSVAR